MERQTIFLSPQSKPTKPINAKDVAILESIRDLWYLTPEQAEKLHWKGKAHSSAHTALTNLHRQGYAETVNIWKETTRGRPAFAYRLGNKALPLFRSLGRDVPTRLHHYRQPGQHLPHSLAVNDVIINGLLLSRYQEQVQLTRYIHELVLHQKKPRVTLPDGKTKGFELDGVLFFDIHEKGGVFDQICLLEVDMGNARRYWRDKLTFLLQYANTQYRTDYQSDSFTMLVYSPKGEEHLGNLLLWTEELMTEMQLKETDLPKLFFFTCHPAGVTHPVDFFLAPVWRQPFSTTRTSPLEVTLA